MTGRAQQTLRIIGGEWRGRKFQFPSAEHLRPTPDRVRETLFNWLMPIIEGARCLDLFCGSGALGLEALSRGASEVMFVDKNKQVIDTLKRTCELVKTDKARFFCGDANRFLDQTATAFDVIFLDPPYDLDLIEPIAKQLVKDRWLSPSAYIYIEHDGRFDVDLLPPTWQAHREKVAGQVYYSLYIRQD